MKTHVRRMFVDWIRIDDNLNDGATMQLVEQSPNDSTFYRLAQLSLKEPHFEASLAAKRYLKSEAHLLSVLEVVEDRQIYLEFGLTSLFKYCTRVLDLPEALSYALISVIRKSREVPPLRDAVQSGSVSLFKSKWICSVITIENHREWIELARHETSRVVERCVALANPKELTQESAVYKTADRLEYKLGVSEEWLAELKLSKDILSQKHGRNVDSEEALYLMMRAFNERHSPIAKAKRAESRRKAKSVSEQCTGTVTSPSVKLPKVKVRKKPARLTLHQVTLRDQNQCTYVGSLGRCDERRWLDIHHIQEVSRGGTDDLENLTTLCRKHHRTHHLGKTSSDELIRTDQEMAR